MGMKHERWVVTGASGQLGRSFLDFVRRQQGGNALELLGVASQARHVSGLDVVALDLADVEATSAFLNRTKPDRIFHFASPARPALVEERPELGKKVDVDATGVIARFAASSGAWMFFASSDFVHEGRRTEPYYADEPCHPVCRYGRFKAAGEEQVRKNLAGAVGRVAMMYDEGPNCVPGPWRSVMDRLMQNAPVFGVTDEFRAPIRVHRVCEIVYRLARSNFRGVINISGDEVVSPFELLTQIALRIDSASEIVPVTQSEYYPGMLRPNYVALFPNSCKPFARDETVAEIASEIHA